MDFIDFMMWKIIILCAIAFIAGVLGFID